MAQVPCIGLYKPCTNLPFGVCAMYFYPQVHTFMTNTPENLTVLHPQKNHLHPHLVSFIRVMSPSFRREPIFSIVFKAVDGRDPAKQVVGGEVRSWSIIR